MGALVSDTASLSVRFTSGAPRTGVADRSPGHCDIPFDRLRTGLIEQAGLKRSEASIGAVALIQRFGSAANLNIHLHCLVLDGAYRTTEGVQIFHAVRAPTAGELQAYR